MLKRNDSKKFDFKELEGETKKVRASVCWSSLQVDIGVRAWASLKPGASFGLTLGSRETGSSRVGTM